MEVDNEHVFLPGDDVTEYVSAIIGDAGKKFVTGPGLIRDERTLRATVAGRLMSKKDPPVVWIHANQRRYVPINGERVVGVIVSKAGLSARVDIGANDLASLNLLAFESATKKNRPDVKVGDIVYARVVLPVKDAEVELVCITSNLKKDGMGLLSPPSGHFAQVCDLSIHFVRQMLSPTSHILESLGQQARFEIAIGMNGRVWIAAKTIETLVLISNLLVKCDNLAPSELPCVPAQLVGASDIKK